MDFGTLDWGKTPSDLAQKETGMGRLANGHVETFWQAIPEETASIIARPGGAWEAFLVRQMGKRLELLTRFPEGRRKAI